MNALIGMTVFSAGLSLAAIFFHQEPDGAPHAQRVDFDGDGLLDLFVSSRLGDRLFRTLPAGGYEDVTVACGLEGASSRVALWRDFDGDGDPDLVLLEEQCRLMRNEGGRLVDSTERAGLAHDGVDLGVSWRDVDGDSVLELEILQADRVLLFRQSGGSFLQSSELAVPLLVRPGTGAEQPARVFEGEGEPGAVLPGDTAVDPRLRRDPDGPAQGVPFVGDVSEPAGDTSGGSVLASSASAGNETAPPHAPLMPVPMICSATLQDAASPGTCLPASSVPELGALYPVGRQLWLGAEGVPEDRAFLFDFKGTGLVTDRLELYGATLGQAGELGPHWVVQRVSGNTTFNAEVTMNDVLHIRDGAASDVGLIEVLDGTSDVALANTLGGSALVVGSDGRVRVVDTAQGQDAMAFKPGVHGGGQLQGFNTAGESTFVLDTNSATDGGRLRLYGAGDPNPAVILLSRDGGNNTGAELQLKADDGTTTFVVDAEYNDGGGARAWLNDSTGQQTIVLDAENGRAQACTIQITGGCDIAEPLEVVGSDVRPGMLVAIDPVRPGGLELASEPYQRTLVGVISGAGGIRPGMTLTQDGAVGDGEHPVALSGRVWCWSDASAGPIEPGDLLTSSSVPGHAMPASDRERAFGSVIGKAMTGLEAGRGLVLVWVNLQ